MLSGLIDPTEIGVVGHSDGADVSLAVATNTCCRDPRVEAAAILSGAELASFGGSYAFSGACHCLSPRETPIPSTSRLQCPDLQRRRPSQVLPRPSRRTHEAPYADPGPDQQIVARSPPTSSTPSSPPDSPRSQPSPPTGMSRRAPPHRDRCGTSGSCDMPGSARLRICTAIFAPLIHSLVAWRRERH